MILMMIIMTKFRSFPVTMISHGNVTSNIVLVCVVLDFCFSYYWGLGWPELQLEERFRWRTTAWQGGWEKLLWLLFPNPNSIFLKHVSSGEWALFFFFFLSPFELNNYIFCVFLVIIWSTKTLGGRFLFAVIYIFGLVSVISFFCLVCLVGSVSYLLVFNGPLNFLFLLLLCSSSFSILILLV